MTETRTLYETLSALGEPSPEDDVERWIGMIERAITRGQFADRMVIVRSLVKDLRQAWDKYRAEKETA